MRPGSDCGRSASTSSRMFLRSLHHQQALARRSNRQTPAYRHNDGLDTLPTNQYVLLVTISPRIAVQVLWLVQLLAAQMGLICPRTLWILGGVVFAGAVCRTSRC